MAILYVNQNSRTCIVHNLESSFKKVNRKVQGMSQSQTAANHRRQEKNKMTKTYTLKTNKQS